MGTKGTGVTEACDTGLEDGHELKRGYPCFSGTGLAGAQRLKGPAREEELRTSFLPRKLPTSHFLERQEEGNQCFLRGYSGAGGVLGVFLVLTPHPHNFMRQALIISILQKTKPELRGWQDLLTSPS